MFSRLLTFAALAFTAFAAEPPSYVCQRADTPITIDGKGDEVCWQRAAALSPLRDIEGGAIEDGTRIKMLWDDSYLYVLADIPEPDLRATLTEHDSIIFRDPDFEVFIDPMGEGNHYIELEMNALGTVWDLFIARTYRETHPVILHDWNIPGLRRAVHCRGTLNDASDRDEGWCAELAIPWRSITGHGTIPRRDTPPEAGTRMRMNFSCVNHIGDTETNHVWAPTGVVNIHLPEHWGYVTFSDKTAGTPELPAPRVFLWVHGGEDTQDTDLWRERFRSYAEAGVDTVIIGDTVEQIHALAPLARAEGLEVFAWFWTLNRPQDAEPLRHPDWFAVSREGRSCFAEADRPYVPYYQFLCPNNAELRQYLLREAEKLCSLPCLAAVQMDYMRLPDVILPRELWGKYGLTMDRELPPYDFCYCDTCRRLFRERYGRDIAEQPEQDTEWREFRLQSIAELAALLSARIHACGKRAACAVFPTPQLAAQLVRQDWSRFPLDLALPMDYSAFYDAQAAPTEWTQHALRAAREQTHTPLAPGLHLPDLTPEQFRALLNLLRQENAAGISLFSSETFSEEHRSVLRKWKQRENDK